MTISQFSRGVTALGDAPGADGPSAAVAVAAAALPCLFATPQGLWEISGLGISLIEFIEFIDDPDVLFFVCQVTRCVSDKLASAITKNARRLTTHNQT